MLKLATRKVCLKRIRSHCMVPKWKNTAGLSQQHIKRQELTTYKTSLGIYIVFTWFGKHINSNCNGKPTLIQEPLYIVFFNTHTSLMFRQDTVNILTVTFRFWLLTHMRPNAVYERFRCFAKENHESGKTHFQVSLFLDMPRSSYRANLHHFDQNENPKCIFIFNNVNIITCYHFFGIRWYPMEFIKTFCKEMSWKLCGKICIHYLVDILIKLFCS